MILTQTGDLGRAQVQAGKHAALLAHMVEATAGEAALQPVGERGAGAGDILLDLCQFRAPFLLQFR